MLIDIYYFYCSVLFSFNHSSCYYVLTFPLNGLTINRAYHVLNLVMIFVFDFPVLRMTYCFSSDHDTCNILLKNHVSVTSAVSC